MIAGLGATSSAACSGRIFSSVQTCTGQQRAPGGPADSPSPQGLALALLPDDQACCWLPMLPQAPSAAEANVEIHRKGQCPGGMGRGLGAAAGGEGRAGGGCPSCWPMLPPAGCRGNKPRVPLLRL